jgi:hypothetical protein
MDPKQLALQFFDKAVLAGFFIWMAVAAAGFVQHPAELDKKDQLDADLKKIAQHMSGSTVDAPADPGWQAGLRAHLDPKTVAAAKPGPSWLLHRRPAFIFQVKDTTPTYTAKHGAPTDVSVDSSTRGQVSVHWKASLEDEYVICSFEVSRAPAQDGPWEVVATEGPGTTEYVDNKVAPRSTYFYKVTSVAEVDRDSPVVQRYDLKLADAEARKESEVAGPAQTAADVFVLPQQVTQVTDQDLIANPNAKESAYVKVYKWDPESSSFQYSAFMVQAHDGIGGKKKLRGGKEFDFTTGAVLDDVWIEQRPDPKIPGHQMPVQCIRIKFADGTTVEFNDQDKPAELGNN